jgi:4-amino-4-deoxy-L-arabinose transferase-like glycosyltransferase
LLAIGVIAAIWVNRKRLGDSRGRYLFLFGGWFVTNALVFSFAQGIFHTYYLVLLGPPVAALTGAGISSLWSTFSRGHWSVRLLLPLALVLTAIWQLHVLQSYRTWATTLTPWLVVAIAASVVLVLLLGLALMLRQWRRLTLRFAIIVSAVALLALFAAPFTWSATTTLAAGNSVMPSAGPTAGQNGGFGGRGGFGGGPGIFNPGSFAGIPGGPGSRGNRNGIAPNIAVPNTGTQGQPGEVARSNLISFLQTNNDGYLYLVAVSSANEASSIVLETGQPVLAMGGFSGNDPAMTPAKLQDLVASKQLRFIMGGGGFGRGNNSSTINSWIRSNCTLVDSALYGQQNGSQLYDCAAR